MTDTSDKTSRAQLWINAAAGIACFAGIGATVLGAPVLYNKANAMRAGGQPADTQPTADERAEAFTLEAPAVNVTFIEEYPNL